MVVKLAGKIAVIRRGTCEFGFKALALKMQGAVAVIMVNNVQVLLIGMAGGARRCYYSVIYGK